MRLTAANVVAWTDATAPVVSRPTRSTSALTRLASADSKVCSNKAGDARGRHGKQIVEVLGFVTQPTWMAFKGSQGQEDSLGQVRGTKLNRERY